MVCDSVAIINKGKVWAFGKLTELYKKYAIGIIRVTTDSASKLAAELKKLKYVEDVASDRFGE